MASLLFINFDDLVTEFAKDHDLSKWEILVVSREITGSLKQGSSEYYGIAMADSIKYESKYDNIEFVDSLRPQPDREGLYSSGEYRRRFIEKYESKLIGNVPFTDACCIIDMIVNENCDVMIVMSQFESEGGIDDILRDFLMEQFGVYGYNYSDLKTIMDNYGKPNFNAIKKNLGVDIPDTFTGKNIEVIIEHFTDNLDEVKKNLEAQKIIAANIGSTAGEENDITSVFFNRFTEDLEDKVKEILEKKDIEYIKELCRQKKIRIGHNPSKEFLIDKIMFNMKKDAAREVHYEENY